MVSYNHKNDHNLRIDVDKNVIYILYCYLQEELSFDTQHEHI